MADEVDAVVAAWLRELPGLPVGPMQVWSRVQRLALHLDAARRRAYASHDLETWEFDVLAALRRSGVPFRLTPGQLIRETHVTSGTMTNRVDRLAHRGFVVREADDSDGRLVLVRLTEAGQEAVDAALTDLLAAERDLLGPRDEESVGRLAGELRDLLTYQEQRDPEDPT